MIFVYTQMFYFFSYILLGGAMYFLAGGLNIKMPLNSMIAIMATISVSALAGYIAFSVWADLVSGKELCFLC